MRDLLAAVNDGIHQVRQHQRTPMGAALACAGLRADTALVDSLLMFDRRRLQIGLLGGDAAPSSARLDRLPSYPLTLCVYDEPQIHLSLIWDRRRFAEGSAPVGCSISCAPPWSSSRATCPGSWPTWTSAERPKSDILAEWNRTRASLPGGRHHPRCSWPRSSGTRTRSRLIFGAAELTYGELDRRSNALAWLLRRAAWAPIRRSRMAIERGADLIVALLAVLKAGRRLPADRPRQPAGPRHRHDRRPRGPASCWSRRRRRPGQLSSLGWT